MSELRVILEGIGLQEYFGCFVENGFNSWDNITGVSEVDLASFGVKLGHRRKLQREIARRLVHAPAAPLVATRSVVGNTKEGHCSRECIAGSSRSKRRYRRHPPRDPSAPIRPDTAYVAYVKFMRQDPEIASLSFIEIAKLLGYRWSHLSSTVKGIWIRTAAREREEYASALVKYRQTKEYRVFCGASKSKTLTPDLLVYHDSASPGNYFPCSESGLPSPIDKGKLTESFPHDSIDTLQTESELAHCGSTASPSSTYTMDSMVTSALSNPSSPASSVFESADAKMYVPLIEIVWQAIFQMQDTNPNISTMHLSYDDFVLDRIQPSTISRNFHVQAINTFDLQPTAVIKATLERFLQNINSVYFLINPDNLWNYWNSASDENSETSNTVLSLLCICLALGYQASPTEAAEMAVMWYENGRRYLDEHDWSLSLAVMQILALVSMYHMSERPAISSYYLDAAMRIGEGNGLHKITDKDDKPNISSNIKWLSIWNTMQSMHRILFLRNGASDFMLRPRETLPSNIQDITYKHITAQSTMATSAFSALSNILGGIQQQLGQSNTMPLWRGRLFTKDLEAWLHCLPDDLSLPMISKTQRVDQFMMKDILSEASEVKKAELLHLHSLYYGTMSLLKSSFLQGAVTATTDSSTSVEEVETTACECLEAALQLIDLCTTLFSTSKFPTYAGLPQSALFTSSLTCILGIIWQRRLVAHDNSITRDWLDRTSYGLLVTLDIFKYCARTSGQAQQHYTVLQQILSWLEGGVG